ncbi:MAG: ABC transporter ATP-binding protein [Candidatus Dojkabacteria bacterium]
MKNPDNVIEVEHLYKKFTRSLKRSLFYGLSDVTRNMLGTNYDQGKLRKGEFWSLEDINFTLKKGEALGIIGQNGSGKTTLLRIINGIFPPDKGEVRVKGKIGALIAVGAGFHPHMTGRENIYLNGTILGMTKEDIEREYENIINFADIGDFIDAPVATYSSGMTIRLGFSIAIHSKPEILLADEVLAVGDLGFALKCYRKIAEYRESGGSIILVSHGLQLIRNTCKEVLWIDKGVTKEYGDAQSVCDHYEKFILEKDSKNTEGMGSIIHTDDKVRITGVEFFNTETKNKEVKVGDPLTIRINFDSQRKINKPIFTVSLSNPENIQVISNYTNFDGFPIDSLEGKGYLDFKVDKLSLKASEYKCTITLTENNDINNHLEWHDKAYNFRVDSNGTISYGLVTPFPQWDLKLEK